MRVFVTGGNGFIGSQVVRALVAAGHAVVCLLRETSKTERIDGVAHERSRGDVRDIESLRAGMRGCDGVIHLAGLSSWDLIDSPEMRDVVLGGAKNVLAVATECGVERVVVTSSITAIGGTAKPVVLDETTTFNLDGVRGLTYAQVKHEADQLCREAVTAGLDVVIVHPGETYGPGDDAMVTAGNLVDFVKSAPVLVCNGGVCVAHVDDVARGIVRALERGTKGERYVLGGSNVTLRELAAATLDAAGKHARIVVLPNWLIRALTRTATTLRIGLPYNPKVIPYATRYFFMSAAKAERDLGLTFRPLRDTLEPTVAWLRQTGRL